MTPGLKTKMSPLRMGLALAAVLAVAPALAGCSDAQVQDAVNGAVQGATDGDVSLGGALPDGWPAEIPVIDGEIKFGAGNTTNGDQGWVVTVASGAADPLADAEQKLVDAGFVPDTSASANVGDVGVVALKNATHIVTIAGTPDGVLYTVAPA
ncbi:MULTISPECIES: hypothetical protein [unclassified Cryobacterium]|uniref:hypothetical protein n=1 Tax=unclassified Cryobacterium TaxID=2649013 RepID=UPI00106AEFFB|nr:MULTISPECIES: hypothetical protein [unclassified Cryobacterium]TFC62636.1 hypothetical protein E3O60_01965 [Cryobacterium sp. TMB1-7]TFC84909.1 hypothetical protein E3T19_18280 [Cryobacterium sp. TMT4-31]